jgi:hypothetical protein
MPFSQTVAAEALVRCARRCCICRRFCGTKMQLHHIVPEANGGADTTDNCIPLCLECHEEVGSYNPAHPIGRKFTELELRQHRDVWFDFVQTHPERLTYSSDSLLRPSPEVVSPTPDILATIEPYYHEVGVWSAKGHRQEEVFAAKVRNQGIRPIYVDIIGFTAGTKKYPGLFSPYSAKNHDDASEILPGRTQVFSCFGVKLEEEDLPRLDGMYLVTGSGHEFVNKNLNLERLIRDWQNERT